eukprot:TRINITY_DN24294_c0_g1_i1.p1 TRINITY_DN24294_c0_g1~~TRINITY_DN24294_c0_g1_i1.p1  ORF type:complete len:584 (+),score=70.18 TRINITY_DN24294_c0_g1_i1:69-1820(+)
MDLKPYYLHGKGPQLPRGPISQVPGDGDTGEELTLALNECMERHRRELVDLLQSNFVSRRLYEKLSDVPHHVHQNMPGTPSASPMATSRAEAEQPLNQAFDNSHEVQPTCEPAVSVDYEASAHVPDADPPESEEPDDQQVFSVKTMCNTMSVLSMNRDSDGDDVRDTPGNQIKYHKKRARVTSSRAGSCMINLAISWVTHPRFEMVVTFLILISAVALGCEVDWKVQHLNAQPPQIFRILEIFLLVAFGSELLVRIVAERRDFIRSYNPNLGWNGFDCVLVLSSLVDEVLQLTVDSSVDLTAMRMIRLMRLLRVVRVIRVFRFFSELRMMINGIMTSGKSLLWAMLLIILLSFIFGVLIMQLAVDTMQVSGDSSALTTYYGTVPKSMLSLYKAISGGLDWNEVMEPLLEISWFMEYVFSGYIFFLVFCCLNIIAAIFLENALSYKQKDEQDLMNESINRERAVIQEIEMLYRTVHVDSTVDMGLEIFRKQVSHPRVKALFKNIGINVDAIGAATLFELLDIDENGIVDINEFTRALSQFHGHARNIDLYRLRQQARHTHKQVKTIFQQVQQVLKLLADKKTNI